MRTITDFINKLEHKGWVLIDVTAAYALFQKGPWRCFVNTAIKDRFFHRMEPRDKHQTT